MNDRDVTTAWRNLFRQQPIDAAVIAKARSLVDSLGAESPLRLRLSTELDELCQLQQAKKPAPASRPRQRRSAPADRNP